MIKKKLVEILNRRMYESISKSIPYENMHNRLINNVEYAETRCLIIGYITFGDLRQKVKL